MNDTGIIKELRDARYSRGSQDVDPCPPCFLCGGDGGRLYERLMDWLLGVPGDWELRQCSACGVMWLTPQPAEKDIPTLYPHYYTHKGIPKTKFDDLRRAISRQVLARMGYRTERSAYLLPWLLSHVPSFARAAALDVMRLQASETGTLLDVGCGNGEFLVRMQSLGWKVTGVEPDPAAIEYSRSQGLKVLHGMIMDVPENTSYDVITVNHVIEHVTDPIALLKECAKRLRVDGGRLIITTPNTKSLGHLWFGRYWRGLEVPRHIKLFSPAALGECVKRAGLHVDSIQTETRMARMIYNPSACAKAGEFQVGRRTNFRTTTKIAAYLFQALEDLWINLEDDAGEEIFCVCSTPAN